MKKNKLPFQSILCAVIAALLPLSACQAAKAPDVPQQRNTPTPVITLDATTEPTETPTMSPVPTEAPTPVLTPIATEAPTPTTTPDPTATPTPTATPSPTATPVPTATSAPTATPDPTATPTPTTTPTPTATPTPVIEGWIDGAKTQYSSKLPVVYITIGNQRITKDAYVTGSIRIQGNAVWSDQYEGSVEMKGRGNSSWSMPKKPYKIKLETKETLFGMDKSKHFVLLANYIDEANLRNRIANDLADQIGLLSMKSEWVQVVLNGKYVGLYQLSEQVRPSKVDGLLFEISEEYDEAIKFRTKPSRWPVMVRSEEEVTENPELLEQAKSIWNRLDEAIHSKDGYASDGTYYADLIDMDSWIKYWLVTELTNNGDAVKKSRFVYLNSDNRLVFGPLWDSDYSLNTTDKVMTAWHWASDTGALDDPTGWKIATSTHSGNFFSALLQHEDFKTRAYELFRTEFAPIVSKYLNSKTIDYYFEYLYDAGLANEALWKFDRGFEKDYKAMYDFLKKRFEWMKQEIN